MYRGAARANLALTWLPERLAEQEWSLAEPPTKASRWVAAVLQPLQYLRQRLDTTAALAPSDIDLVRLRPSVPPGTLLPQGTRSSPRSSPRHLIVPFGLYRCRITPFSPSSSFSSHLEDSEGNAVAGRGETGGTGFRSTALGRVCAKVYCNVEGGRPTPPPTKKI